MPSLNDKTVIITGALGTIGKALVERFAQEGATAITSDRPDSDPTGLVGVRYFGADLNKLPDLESAVSQLVDEVGGVDILVNNAAFVVNKPHEEFSIAEYEEEIRVNSTAAFVLSEPAASM